MPTGSFVRTWTLTVALAAGAAIPEAFAAGSRSPARPPPLAVMVSSPGGQTSSLQAGDGPVLATLSHPPYAVVRGRTLPGTRTALVVADTWVHERDGSFDAAVYRLDAGKDPVLLAGGVVSASRPWVTDDGRVFVERGRYGPEVSDEDARTGRLRTDALRIDEVNPTTGEARTVHGFEGYATHLAGSLDRELIAYRVSFAHADLVAIDMDSGAVRVLAASLPPFARDFSVDRRRGVLVFTDARAGQVLELQVRGASHELRVVAEDARNDAFAPWAWPDGRVAWNDGRGAFVVSGARVDAVSGGTALVRAVSSDGRWLAIDRTRPSELPEPFVVSADLRTGVRVPSRPGERLDVLGFMAEEAR